MFQSATLKLTGWYLGILMTISLIFSLVIYQINYNEINLRLQNLQQSVIEIAPGIFVKGSGRHDLNIPRTIQASEAARQLFWSLVWTNLSVLILGGLASYYFARKTLEPIEKVHESQSRFTSDASHELRTPLTAIKTEIEVSLQDTSLSLDEAKLLLESNLEEVDNLIELSEMLLQLSRSDNGVDLERQKVNLTAIAEEFYDSHAQKDRFTLTARKEAPVSGNASALLEVMTILSENALKFSTNATPISVRIFQRRHLIGFEISNQGDPIPKQYIERLFDRFYQVESSRTRTTKSGHGLGLSIAKKIVETHNGTIAAKSQDGQVFFTFLLPRYKS